MPQKLQEHQEISLKDKGSQFIRKRQKAEGVFRKEETDLIKIKIGTTQNTQRA